MPITHRALQLVVENWPGLSYLLRDEFHTNRAAGSVNGTSPEPGPGGPRTAVDPTLGLSVSGGRAQVTAGGGAWARPGLWYAAQTQTAGMILHGKLIVNGASHQVRFGWDDGQDGAIGNEFIEFGDGQINVNAVVGAIVAQGIGTISPGVEYDLWVVKRAWGHLYFIQGGAYTYPTLLYSSTSSGLATRYPGFSWGSGAGSHDGILIPDASWFARMLAYDAFGRTNGSLGQTETTDPDEQSVPQRAWVGGANWVIDAQEATNSPVAGNEILANGDMETGSPPTGWTPANATLAASADAHGGAQSLQVTATAANGNGFQSNAGVLGTWYIATVWAKATVGDSYLVKLWSTPAWSDISDSGTKTNTAYEEIVVTGRLRDANISLSLYALTNGDICFFDDASLKPLTLADLISCVETSTADVEVTVELDTLLRGTQAGIILSLDDENSPQNFVIGYHDGVSAHLDKCVGGTYTTVISAAATYVAEKNIRVIKDGTTYMLFYNDSKVGSTSTISDAAIVNNTKHGLFSTYSGNQLDNFGVFPRGTKGEFLRLRSLQ